MYHISEWGGGNSVMGSNGSQFFFLFVLGVFARCLLINIVWNFELIRGGDRPARRFAPAKTIKADLFITKKSAIFLRVFPVKNFVAPFGSFSDSHTGIYGFYRLRGSLSKKIRRCRAKERDSPLRSGPKKPSLAKSFFCSAAGIAIFPKPWAATFVRLSLPTPLTLIGLRPGYVV